MQSLSPEQARELVRARQEQGAPVHPDRQPIAAEEVVRADLQGALVEACPDHPPPGRSPRRQPSTEAYVVKAGAPAPDLRQPGLLVRERVDDAPPWSFWLQLPPYLDGLALQAGGGLQRVPDAAAALRSPEPQLAMPALQLVREEQLILLAEAA